ncbi:hypothetical protein MSAN_00421100 [Mycena sanguinolenta]|uniref:DUF6533 domain-containing protein n=1 Tax=Mycena sanguinolenta TaxID=230812 RepID=A0A8H7DIA4_9AGAR|nr:hypothetical protein MSAN_00421100 [Mycena sanguinolenta]
MLVFPEVRGNFLSMSSDSFSMGGLDYPTFAWDHLVYRYMFLFGFVILIYDHFLTFDDEVRLIWRRPLRPSALWFFAVRYFSLACSIGMLFFYFWDFTPASIHQGKVMETLLMGQETLVEVTLALRVMGMYGNSLKVRIPLAVLGGIIAGLGLWTMIEYGEPQMLTAPGMSGCHTALPRKTALILAGVWESQTVFDLFVFILTVYRAHADRAVISMVQGSLVERMMRDGAMYFGIIALANLADVLTLYLGDVLIAGILSWGTTSLSVTLISRLILNLHRAGEGNTSAMTHDTTQLEGYSLRQPAAGTPGGLVVRGVYGR